MMKHKDIRPYICSECGMEFIQSHHLKQHTLTHKVGLTNRTERKDSAFSVSGWKKKAVFLTSNIIIIISIIPYLDF